MGHENRPLPVPPMLFKIPIFNQAILDIIGKSFGEYPVRFMFGVSNASANAPRLKAPLYAGSEPGAGRRNKLHYRPLQVKVY